MLTTIHAFRTRKIRSWHTMSLQSEGLCGTLHYAPQVLSCKHLLQYQIFVNMLAIIITDSSGFTHSHYLFDNGASYTIGRSADCSFPLPEEGTLSDTHCQLTVVDGYVYLQDCGSTNGIYIGDRQVTEEYMQPEHEYQIGSCRLVLTNIEEAGATATPAPRRAAKLKPKAVTSTPEAAAPRRAAKLKPKAVTASAPVAEPPVYSVSEPLPVYQEEPPQAAPAEIAPEPQPVYQEETPQAEPAEIAPEPQPVYQEETPQAAPAEIAPEPLTVYQEEATQSEPAEVSPAPQEAAPAAASAPETTSKSRLPKKKKVTVKKAAAPKVHKELYRPEPPRTGVLAQLPRDFDLKLRLVNKEKQQKVGTALRFALVADCACHVYLLQYDSEGSAGLLVPGMAGIAHSIPAGVEMQFPNIGLNEYQLMVEPPTGTETIIALACTHPGNMAEVWQQLVQQSTAPLTPGAVEIQAIKSCDSADKAWSSAIIQIQTIG